MEKSTGEASGIPGLILIILILKRWTQLEQMQTWEITPHLTREKMVQVSQNEGSDHSW